MLRLGRGAYILDVIESEIEDNDLNEASKRRGNDLAHEHRPRRDLHVVAEFEIRNEAQGLCHGDVTKRLESARNISESTSPGCKARLAYIMRARGLPGWMYP